MNSNYKTIIFLMVISLLFWVGCGSNQVDIMPNLSSASLNINVEWPVRQLNQNSAKTAPPAALNISTIEILLIDLAEYSAIQAQSTNEIDSFYIGKDMNSRYYEFDVKEGSEYRDGTEITDIPAGNYAFFFMPEDVNGDYPFYYFEKISIEDGKATNVNIQYGDWTIDVPVGASAAPAISQRTADTLTLDWYDNGTNDSYAIYVDGSLYTNYDASLDTSEGFLYLEITGLDNGTDYSIHFETIKDSQALEQFDIAERTKFFADVNLETAIIIALNSVLPADSQISSESQLTPELLASPAFTSFIYTPTNTSPAKESSPKKATGAPLSDLTGLEFCQSVVILSIPGNSISDISVLSALTALEELDISSNAITDLTPITSLSNLVDLNLSSNAIVVLPTLSNLTNLTSLDVGGNQISDISAIAVLTNISNLNLSGNQVTDVSALATLTLISNLNLSGNLVSDISALASLTNLQAVDLSGNQVTDVSVLASLPSLTIVALVGNPPELDLSVLENTNITLDIIKETKITDVSISGSSDTIDVSFSVRNIADSTIYAKFILSDSSEIEYPSSATPITITETTGTKTLSINTQSIPEFFEQYVEDLKIRIIPGSDYPDETNAGTSSAFTLDNVPPTTQISNVNVSGNKDTIDVSFSVAELADTSVYVKFILSDSSEIEYPSSATPINITGTTGTKTLSINTQSIPEFFEQNIQDIKIRITPGSTYPDETNAGTSSLFDIYNAPHPPQITNLSYTETGSIIDISYSLNDDMDSTNEVAVYIKADGINYEPFNSNYITGDMGVLNTGNTYNVSLDLAPYYRGTTETVAIAISGSDSIYYGTGEISFDYNAFDMIQLNASELLAPFELFTKYTDNGDLCALATNENGLVFFKYYKSTLDNASGSQISADISTVIYPSEISITDFDLIGDNPIITVNDCMSLTLYYSNDGGQTFSNLAINNDLITIPEFPGTPIIIPYCILTTDDTYAYLGFFMNLDVSPPLAAPPRKGQIIGDGQLPPLNPDLTSFFIGRFDGSTIDTFEVAVINDGTQNYGPQEPPFSLLKTQNGDYIYNAVDTTDGSMIQFVAVSGDWENKIILTPDTSGSYDCFKTFETGTDVLTAVIYDVSGLEMKIYSGTSLIESINLSQNNPVYSSPATGITKHYSWDGSFDLYVGAFTLQEGTKDEIYFICKDTDSENLSEHYVLSDHYILSDGAYYNGKISIITEDNMNGDCYLIREK
ncbi:MAG: hypothetical protein C0601_09810 [Candidatus Muiribacterium halophilum]|uniref:Uncharacterized protein n=1 Tax=Muiribacterium halophilum TaxID=2053465 RepID=A0A2N5ZDD2_MUIH1|nr:MAG: hypothetical protein C0601_09810 [Candidatus Muirbacterium halophilum]